jgi:membrane protease YdiL (CAAX protease family)
MLGLLLFHPVGRRALRDERMAWMTARTVIGEVLLRIPLGTVVLEEVTFRGVLPALGSTRLSCLVFGLWHIAPTRRMLDLNSITSPLARVGTIAGACVATAFAGMYLCQLRSQGGLAAPAVAHAAVNGLATIAAVIAHHLANLSPDPPCHKGSSAR